MMRDLLFGTLVAGLLILLLHERAKADSIYYDILDSNFPVHMGVIDSVDDAIDLIGSPIIIEMVYPETGIVLIAGERRDGIHWIELKFHDRRFI